MFASFTDFLSDVSGKGQTSFARLKNKTAFNRMVWACFLIANADGEFDADEKSALAKLIQKQLPEFVVSDILKAIATAQEKVDFDTTMGTQELMAEIGKAKGDDAEALIRAACFIGASDGDFDPKEKEVVRQLCGRLELNPVNFGL